MYLFPPVNGPCPAKRMRIFTDVASFGHCFYCGARWVCFGTVGHDGSALGLNGSVMKWPSITSSRNQSVRHSLFVCWNTCPSVLRSLPQKPNEYHRYCPRLRRTTSTQRCYWTRLTHTSVCVLTVFHWYCRLQHIHCAIIPVYFILLHVSMWGTRWRSWLRHCATSRKTAGSIPDGVIGIFHWYNPSGRTMALELTNPLPEMSTRNISWWGKGGRCIELTTLLPSCADCLEIWDLQPPGILRACPGL
jgi:hypothetical protein